MSDTSGRSWLTPLALYVPDESSSRTWQVTSLWGWTPFSGTLPRWGMTRRGELYELPTPALPIAESASSSLPSHLLPTPDAGNFNDGQSVEAWQARAERQRAKGNPVTMTHGTPLAMVVRLLPTPMTSDANGSGMHGDGGMDLRTAVTLLPTPTRQNNHGNTHGSTGRLLLPGVAEVLGGRTELLSLAGRRPSDAPLPDLLSPDEPESA